ncbi:hypothetical protein ACJIZ3_000308 [Penstemon smallii]|uniref:TF-B3 domain-containing protein n=1 Tax=Penstemon smallii TaxID=265156 RepID=A0ABD3R4Y2_9LAMI
MFDYCGGLKFQVRIYQRGGCEPSFMLTGNSMVQVSNEEEAYNCECRHLTPAPSSNYKPKEPEIIYVDDDDDDNGNNEISVSTYRATENTYHIIQDDNSGSVELAFVTSWEQTLTKHNIPKDSTSAPTRLYFPAEKTRRYKLHKNKMARLKFPQHSQQIWDVQVHKYNDTGRKTARIALAEGWKEFAIDNNLRVGYNEEFQIFKPNDQLNEPNEVIQIDVLYN